MEKNKKNIETHSAEIRHLSRRDLLSEAEILKQEMELSIAAHFSEQNQLLRQNNKDLTDQIQRLTNGVENLAQQMDGVRTGKKDEAFARVAGIDARPDLPTVGGEAALYYIYTAKQIGNILGFQASQIGLLLGAKGLGWAGNGDYQEIGRTVSASQSKFWHREVPDRLSKVLHENNPAKHGIKNKSVLSIFRKWQEQLQQAELAKVELSDQPH